MMNLFSSDETIIFDFPGSRILPIPDLSSIRALAPIVIILLIIFRSMEFLVLDSSTEMARSHFLMPLDGAHSNALTNQYTAISIHSCGRFNIFAYLNVFSIALLSRFGNGHESPFNSSAACELLGIT